MKVQSDSEKEATRKMQEEANKILQSRKVDVTFDVKSGTPYEEILKEQQERKADLIVTYPGGRLNLTDPQGLVSVMLGNGDGTFQTPVLYATNARYCWALTVADLNGDGWADVVTADKNNLRLAVLMGDGEGGLQPPSYVYSYSDPTSLAAADLNGDGKQDIVVANNAPFGTVAVGTHPIKPVANPSRGLNIDLPRQTGGDIWQCQIWCHIELGERQPGSTPLVKT